MGLERVDRFQTILREKLKELIEIEISFPYRKMLVHFSVIIVEVDLDHVLAKGIEPVGEGGFVEDMVMAGVKTESKMG